MAILKILNTAEYSSIKKGWFISYYHTTKEDVDDVVSKYLLDFKSGEEPITSKWVRIVLSFFTGKFKPDLTLRVLSSSETSCINSLPIDQIGSAIQEKGISVYMPNLLSKSRSTRPMKGLNRKERQEEIQDVYKFIKPDFEVKSVLLLDDIITSGTTIAEIKRAIKKEISNIALYLFVLGKTYNDWTDKDGDNSELKKILID